MEIRAELRERLSASQRLYESGSQVLAQQVVGTVKLPIPFYVREAHGCRVVDVDGFEYIDMTMGFGPLVLGHAPDVITQALLDSIPRGLQWGLYHPHQEELARLLVAASPCADTICFYNSGTEATMSAIRGARVLTGKYKIGIFDGSYHGTHDVVLTQTIEDSPKPAPRFRSWGAGIPPRVIDEVVPLAYRQRSSFDSIRRHRDELAAVIIEAVEASNPRTDLDEFYRELHEVCSKSGVLLIMDEVITGFRLAYGGAQEYFGVVPDLACYGKALGGGMPIGAVAGRAELMETFAIVLEKDAVPPRAVSGGTFAGNPSSMVAGTTALTYLRDHPDVYAHLHTQSNRLATAINEFCAAKGFDAQMLNAESMLYLRFQSGAIDSARDLLDRERLENLYYLYLLRRGVVYPGVHIAFLSYAHRVEDIDLLIEAFTGAFEDMRRDELL